MTHWKIDTFWTAVIATAIASFIVWFSAGLKIGQATPANEPVTYRLEIIYPQPIPALSTGKPSEYESLETRKAIQDIELQTAKEMFNGESRNPFGRVK